MRRKERQIVTDGTDVFMLNEVGIQTIAIADGTGETFLPTYRFTALAYGNSTLYAADAGALYDVDPSTGVATLLSRFEDITGIVVASATNLVLMTPSSLIDYVLADGSYTYIRNDVN